MTAVKQQRLMKKVENHLRSVARKLINFDTEKETLQFLINSFRSQFPCDFAGIMLLEGDKLAAKVTSGENVAFTDRVPVHLEDSTSPLLYRALTYDEMLSEASDCPFVNLLKKETMATWFSVPLMEDVKSYGFCVIGFKKNITLYKEMGFLFSEFGKDVATALKLVREKEAGRRKILNAEWIINNLTLHSPQEEVIKTIVERAGIGTDSCCACIYLYNEQNNSLQFQEPSYGLMEEPAAIRLRNHDLQEHFPFLERPGGGEITVPLTVELRTVGVLHVKGKKSGVYTPEDLELLKLLANHFVSILENARLYNNVINHKKKLQSLLEFQQSLVKETVRDDSCGGITALVGQFFSRNVILFDRFFRPLAYYLAPGDEDRLEELIEAATCKMVAGEPQSCFTMVPRSETNVDIWPIHEGRDLTGFLAVENHRGPLDDFEQLGIDIALNIFAAQFAKQKLIMDAKEQVKDSFINKLLVKPLQDRNSIIQNAHLFNWNLFEPHRVAVLDIENCADGRDENVFEKETKKSILWDRLKRRLALYEPDIQATVRKDEYIFIVPLAKEMNKPKQFWASFHERLEKWLREEKPGYSVFIGAGGSTEILEDYYQSYEQARETLNVVKKRFKDRKVALFDEMGSYVLLRETKDSPAVRMFLEKYLYPLLKYSEEKNADLFHTLRIYLQNHGNISQTANKLFIHRSTLLYRLEKIESLLGVDLNDPDHRFNLMLAARLYDLFY